MPTTAENADFDDILFVPTAETLFDALPDVVFFVKDAEARYLAVNQTLVRRCGLSAKADLVGKTALNVFPPPLGRCYYEEDMNLLRTGAALRDLLQLHLYVQGAPGWCITQKLPLHNRKGTVIGIVGVSNDVHTPADQDSGLGELADAVQHIQQNIASPLRLDALAGLCGLSVYQFEQRMKRVFQLTAGQFITKTRIDAACRLLSQRSRAVVDIALACGFSDQSAFTRQFKATTGVTPTEFRQNHS